MPRNYVTVRLDTETRRRIADDCEDGETVADWLREAARERLAATEREGGDGTDAGNGRGAGDGRAEPDVDPADERWVDDRPDSERRDDREPRRRRDSEGYGSPTDYTTDDDGDGPRYEYVDDCSI